MKRMIWLSSLPENERIGIQFRDFELFCRLLKNLDDFSVAVKYISEVGRPLSRKEFKRAAKVCLNGKELSSHLVDTVFILFGASEGKTAEIFLGGDPSNIYRGCSKDSNEKYYVL